MGGRDILFFKWIGEHVVELGLSGFLVKLVLFGGAVGLSAILEADRFCAGKRFSFDQRQQAFAIEFVWHAVPRDSEGVHHCWHIVAGYAGGYFNAADFNLGGPYHQSGHSDAAVVQRAFALEMAS